MLIIRGSKLYYTASGIITPVGGRPVRRLRTDGPLSTCAPTNYVPREYSVAAILLLLFMVLKPLVPVLNILYFYISTFRSMGTAVAQWLRCCATNRKVAGSISDGDIGIFH